MYCTISCPSLKLSFASSIRYGVVERFYARGVPYTLKLSFASSIRYGVVERFYTRGVPYITKHNVSDNQSKVAVNSGSIEIGQRMKNRQRSRILSPPPPWGQERGYVYAMEFHLDLYIDVHTHINDFVKTKRARTQGGLPPSAGTIFFGLNDCYCAKYYVSE